MKKEFDIEDQWVSFELHPETPLDGILLADRFPGADIEGMMAHLNHTGAPFGIRFGELKRLSNSRLALQAGEFARDQGAFHQFHDLLFKAYFTDIRDIGRIEVLLDEAGQAGLDAGALKTALEDGTYLSRLEEAGREARRQEVKAIPALFFNNGTVGHRIVGAQPFQVFQNTLKTMSQT